MLELGTPAALLTLWLQRYAIIFRTCLGMITGTHFPHCKKITKNTKYETYFSYTIKIFMSSLNIHNYRKNEFASIKHSMIYKCLSIFLITAYMYKILTFPLISTTSCSSTSFLSNSVKDLTISLPTPESIPVFLFW